MPAGDKTESQGLSGKDRVIRVFIPSTFRDMMRERDLLVKEVFPELRRKCAKRFVTFTEVGLRWGITGAQVPDPLGQEWMDHEALAKNELFACIDRPALAALNVFSHDYTGGCWQARCEVTEDLRQTVPEYWNS